MTLPFTTETALKARESIEKQKAKYREHYYDEEYWSDLSWARGVRMPPWYTAPSDQDIKYWLKLAKVPYVQFVESFGWKDSEEFEKLNPNHGMKILAGLILELGQENLRIKKLSQERTVEFDMTIGNSQAPKSGSYVGKSKARRRAELSSLLPR